MPCLFIFISWYHSKLLQCNLLAVFICNFNIGWFGNPYKIQTMFLLWDSQGKIQGILKKEICRIFLYTVISLLVSISLVMGLNVCASTAWLLWLTSGLALPSDHQASKITNEISPHLSIIYPFHLASIYLFPIIYLVIYHLHIICHLTLSIIYCL